MRMPSSLLALIIAAMVSACASTAGYEAMLATWVGAPEAALISRWGPPDSVYDMGASGKVLTYVRSSNFQWGGYTTTTPVTTYHSGNISGDVNANYSGTSTTYVPTTTPVYNIQQKCTTRMTIQNGIVRSWAWEGNACKAKAPDNAAPSASEVAANQRKAKSQNEEFCKGLAANKTEDDVAKCIQRMDKIEQNRSNWADETTRRLNSGQ